MGTYLIRKSVLELGKRFDFLEKPEEIFFMKEDEIEKVISNPENVNKQRIREKIIKRRKQWESWSKQSPPEQIKL